MVMGIVVPRRTSLPMQRAHFADLMDYQRTVGGDIEIVEVRDHPLAIIANEDGKLRRLTANRRATCLWWLLSPLKLGGHVLVGDVVLVGPTADGEITDVPARLVALLLETSSYQVQVRISAEFDSWVPIGEDVNDFFEATVRALHLMEVWSPPSGVRVVAAP